MTIAIIMLVLSMGSLFIGYTHIQEATERHRHLIDKLFRLVSGATLIGIGLVLLWGLTQ